MLRRISALLLTTLLVSACSPREDANGGTRIVASIAPLGEIASRIGGDDVTVELLSPPGAEAHEFEPGPRQIEAIGSADLVIYLGGTFQPAVARAVRPLPAKARLDLMKNTPVLEETHLWLNPDQMRIWTKDVRDRLIELLPDARGSIATNAGVLTEELLALDEGFRTGLRDCDRRTFVAAHAAFGEIATRYELKQEALAGFEPESEPDPAALADIVRIVRREGLTTVFTEPGAPKRVIDTLVRATGTKAAILDPLETSPERKADTYFTRMRANLEALRAALGCR